jgi:Flp pilus assembly protein TadG
MRKLIRIGACPATARSRGDEQGAIMLLFTLLLTFIVGFVALTVDFGQFSTHHSELQSAADATALSAAKQCATSPSGCPSGLNATVNGPLSLAQANDNTVRTVNGTSNNSTVSTPLCGHDSISGILVACAASDFDTRSLVKCPTRPASMPATANYVEVVVHRDTKFNFAPVVGGPSSATGQACAAVRWGPPSSVTGVLPLTLPQCLFDSLTNHGTDFTSTQVVAIAINEDANVPANCDVAPTGNAGWLSEGSATCTSIVADIAIGSPGQGTASSCFQDLVAGQTYYVPIWSSVVPGHGGANGSYMLAGIAAFHLTGFHTNGAHGSGQINIGNVTSPGCPDAGVNPPQPAGRGNNPCIWGYFTTAVAPLGTIDDSGGGNPTGLSVIQQIG